MEKRGLLKIQLLWQQGYKTKNVNTKIESITAAKGLAIFTDPGN